LKARNNLKILKVKPATRKCETKGGARVTHTLQVLLKIHIKPANKKQQMMNVVKTMEDIMILTRCPLAPERYTAFQGRFQLESSRWELQNKAVVYGSIISDYIT
jgi:hypothetical protein